MEASREGHEDVVRLLMESGEGGEGRRGGEGRERLVKEREEEGRHARLPSASEER